MKLYKRQFKVCYIDPEDSSLVNTVHNNEVFAVFADNEYEASVKIHDLAESASYYIGDVKYVYIETGVIEECKGLLVSDNNTIVL